MNRAAVLGSPIDHSLSPVLHRAGYQALGLDSWTYEALRLEVDDLADFMAGLDASWRGLSVTMPLKEATLGVADQVSDLASKAGSANTLHRLADGNWAAHNTDVLGVVEAIRPHLATLPKSALVLGTGATARAAVLALADLGVTRLDVAARSADKAAALLDFAREAGGPEPGEVYPLQQWPERPDVVISALAAPGAPDAATGCGANPGAVLLDVVYADWPTPLARAGAKAGYTVVSGLSMLVHQAAAQFTLFTGAAAPLQAMWDAGSASAFAASDPT